MNIYNESKLMGMVEKAKAGAKDGTLKFDGKVWEFSFNQYQDYYEVKEQGQDDIELRIKERNLNKAKTFFKNYMVN